MPYISDAKFQEMKIILKLALERIERRKKRMEELKREEEEDAKRFRRGRY